LAHLKEQTNPPRERKGFAPVTRSPERARTGEKGKEGRVGEIILPTESLARSQKKQGGVGFENGPRYKKERRQREQKTKKKGEREGIV